MIVLPKIAICWPAALLLLTVGYVNPAHAAKPALPDGGVTSGGVAKSAVVLGGEDALAFNREAVREQVRVWRNAAPELPVTHEITIERYGRPDRLVKDDQLSPYESLAVRPTYATLSHAGVNSDSALAELFGWDDELIQIDVARETVLAHPPTTGEALAGLDVQSELPVPTAEPTWWLDGLNGFDWLVASISILIVAFRMGLWRVLNQAIFLWTAQWEGVTVVASSHHRRSRRRRSSRSSRWTWRSGNRSSSWSPGSRPSRRRSRRRSHSRQRTATRPRSNGTARPSYRRGGREYVVADVVFTARGPVSQSAVPANCKLLTCSNE